MEVTHIREHQLGPEGVNVHNPAFDVTPAGLITGFRVTNWLRWLGRLDDDQLIEQYRNAAVFAFPSLYEGFGIPPLEAQACGCPVVAASSASIPEVLGNSVLYFDPLDPPGMAKALRRVLLDHKLRADLRRLGQENVLRYSWDISALRLSSLIDSFLMERSDYPARFDAKQIAKQGGRS